MSRARVFACLHLNATWQRRTTSLLVVAGIALGIVVLAAILVLVVALGRPFASVADAVSGRANLQVTPLVHDRLPETALRTTRATPGVHAAIPVVGGLSTLRSPGADGGALLIGTDCTIESLIGPFDCQTRVRHMHDGPGAPLAISKPLATRLHANLGDPLAAPGGTLGEAHVGAIIDTTGLPPLNSGHFALGLVPHVQDLTGAGPHLSSVLVTAEPTATTALRTKLAAVAKVGPPGTNIRMFLALTRALLLFVAVLVLVAGTMIAANTYTLSLDDRRKTLAVTEVLGSSPARTVTSLLLEGGLLGLLGGTTAILPGYLLGLWFTARFGNAILRGTGAALTAPFAWWLPAFCILAGFLAGTGAALFPAVRLVREGSLVAIREQGGILPTYRAPRWPAAALALIALGAPLAWAYGNGYGPLPIGLAGFFLAVLGLLGGCVGATPLVVTLATRQLRKAGAAGLLASADLTRDPVRLAAVTTITMLAVSTAIGFLCVTQLAAESIAAKVATEIGRNVYVFPRDMGDQADYRVRQAALARLAQVPGVGRVLPQNLGVLSWGPHGLNVTGTDTTHTRSNLRFVGTSPSTAWERVERGGVILSWVLANREGLESGDMIELPTTEGLRRFPVAAVAKPGFGFDNGIGDLVVASYATAERYWAPGADFVIVVPKPGVDPRRLARRIRSDDTVRLYPLDRVTTPPQAAASVRRFFAPVGIVGFTLIPIAVLAITNFLLIGLLQQRHLRAALHFVGYGPAMQRRALLYQALVMGVLGAAFGTIGALVVSYFTTLISPALLAATVPWRPLPANLLIGVATALGACLVAIIPPSLEAGNLDVLAAITNE